MRPVALFYQELEQQRYEAETLARSAATASPASRQHPRSAGRDVANRGAYDRGISARWVP